MKHYFQSLWISFFISFLFLSCIQCSPSDSNSVDLISKNDKAVGLVIHGVEIEENDLPLRIKIQLVRPGDRAAILGEYKVDGEIIIFEPLVPFTPGLHYEVFLDTSLIAKIEIPKGKFVAPELISVYPTQDTLPENLLKMYLEFSMPMVEGRSLPHLTLIRNDRDTLKGTFLDLQPELWNAESTVLTLWLDPGRIKRDLIPNKELGTPLRADQEYTLHVVDSWKSKNGLPMSKGYSKTFVTTSRDDASPDPMQWIIIAPPSGTTEALEMQLHESLDYYLLKEGVKVADLKGDFVPGVVQVSNEERTYKFYPDNAWSAGGYTLQVETKLEDLAGNNLNRPFDRDVDDKALKKYQNIFLKEFEIQ